MALRFRAAILALGLAGLAVPASAQVPELPREFLETPNRLAGDTLRFCVYDAAATAAFDRRVAEVLAQSLLLNPEFVAVEPPIRIAGLDSIPITLEDMFILMTNECDAFLGIELAPDVYPDWLTFTQAYFTAPYVLAVRAGTHAGLDAIPPRSPIATQIATSADLVFGTYNGERPEARQWRKLPYPQTALQLERLLDGTVEAAIVWQPWFEAGLADETKVSVVPSGDLALPSRAMGIALRGRDTFTRASLDQAIAQLSADGTLQRLYEETYGEGDSSSQ